MSGNNTMQDAIEFIWAEVDMLDHGEFQDWLKLWTEDGKYVIPIDQDAPDFENSLNYAYDDAAMRDMRVRRLTSGQSMSATNAAKIMRTVSRFRLLKSDDPNVITIRCAQNLVEFKYEKLRNYPSNVTYVLVKDGDTFKIHEKVVRLINSQGALAGMTFLL